MSEGVRFIYDDELERYNDEEYERFRLQVKSLMDVPQYEQRSEGWYKQREGRLTASDWGTILGLNKYSRPKSVAESKIFPGNGFKGNVATEWGKKYEEVATRTYERRNNTKVIEFGMIPHPDHDFLGASPDGITEDGIMVEIKCPYRRVITGEVPKHYWCQIQGQLECCDLERCDFLELTLEELDEDEYEEYRVKCDPMDLNEFECGIVFSLIGDNKTKFFYSDFFVTQEEARKKCEEEIGEEWFIDDISFYRVTVISCVPVYRDKGWFVESLPILRDFWERIKACRESEDPRKCFDDWFIPRKRKTKSVTSRKSEEPTTPKKSEFPFSLDDLNDIFSKPVKGMKAEERESDESCMIPTFSFTGEDLF